MSRLSGDNGRTFGAPRSTGLIGQTTTPFHLGDNRLTDIGVGQLIVEAMRDVTCNIATLNLTRNQLGAPVLTQAVKHNRSLTALDISGNPIDGARARAHIRKRASRKRVCAKYTLTHPARGHVLPLWRRCRAEPAG